MKAENLLKELKSLRTTIYKSKRTSAQTKFQVVNLFRELERLASYQVPDPPIEVIDDGHKFTCPRCGTKFETEDTVDDFFVCYNCGQRFKEEE